MSRTRRKKGASPFAAVGFLAVSSVVAFVSLSAHFGGSEPAAADAPGAMLDEEDVQVALPEEDELGVDLLLQHGSWQPGGTVQVAFASLAGAVPAAPIGETAAGRRWVGADPPAMRLGVVLVGDTSRRAVVDGTVVGLGDTIGKAMVVAIERDRLVVTWNGRRLTYDLEGAHPREFRAELRRRGVDPEAAPAAGATASQEEGK